MAGLAGIAVAVNPPSLALATGQTKEFTVTFTNSSAGLNTYSGGQLTLSDGTHNVRVPVVVRPLLFAAPTEVSGSYDVKFSYTGAFTATPLGLVAASTQTGSVVTGGKLQVQFTLPAGLTCARFSLFNTEVSQPDDIDLVLIGPTGEVKSSSGGTSAGHNRHRQHDGHRPDDHAQRRGAAQMRPPSPTGSCDRPGAHQRTEPRASAW